MRRETVELLKAIDSRYFDKVGRENTEATLSIAKKRADELGIKTVLVASTVGDTAARAVDVFKGMRVVVVTHALERKGRE